MKKIQVFYSFLLVICFIFLATNYVLIVPNLQVLQSQQNYSNLNESKAKLFDIKASQLMLKSTTLPYEILPSVQKMPEENQVKIIYHVTNDDKYTDKKGILYSQDFFEQSKFF